MDGDLDAPGAFPSMMLRRASSRMRARSSILSFGMGRLLLLVAPDDLLDPGNGHLAVEVLPHGHHRRQPAASQAAHLLQTEVQVRRGLPGLDPQLAFELFQDLDRALDVAGRAQADPDGMPAFGLQAEGAVKVPRL